MNSYTNTSIILYYINGNNQCDRTDSSEIV